VCPQQAILTLPLWSFATPSDPQTSVALISMDFIKQLLPLNGFTTILVIIDCLLKEVVFIPTMDNATAMDIADAFVTQVFSKHSIPTHVSSDCGSEFTSHFFHSTGSLLCMHLHFTSIHHPSANGQVECINSTLEQYLCIYCNYKQDNWSKFLPLAKFAYNNTPHTITSVLPFFATQGYNPIITMHPNTEVTDLQA
jgi:hypothetical protein